MALLHELGQKFDLNRFGIFEGGPGGYWSNLTKGDNRKMLVAMEQIAPKSAVLSHHPGLIDVIFSPKRCAGLEFLNLKGSETCIDYGCMWGALTVPLAKRTKFVLGVDQTLDSLRFLRGRIEEDNLNNVELLCIDMKKMPIFSNKADIAIVNGVLEWIPEEGEIDLTVYYGKYNRKRYLHKPRDQQLALLKTIYQNLVVGGKLFLAIENRYDFKMFLGAKDPHSKLLFTSFLPRRMANLISMVRLGRPYVNWLYSFNELRDILNETGFSEVELYMCFPDYRFPEKIIPYNRSLRNFQPLIKIRNSEGKISLKRVGARLVEHGIFKIANARIFAPSIITIAHK